MAPVGQFGDTEFLALAVILAAWLLYAKSIRNQTFYFLKFAFYYAMSIIVTTAYIPVHLLRPRDVRNFQLMAPPTKVTGLIIGLRYKLRNMEVLDKVEEAVVVCNHQSTLDVIGMLHFWALLKRCVLVAKSELFYIWPFGLSLWLAGVAFINRKCRKSSYETLEKSAQLIKHAKTKMLIFPEGTRNLNVNATGRLLPFKKGAFRIAVACQVPIVPIVYSPYYFVRHSKVHFFGRGTMTLEALVPIPTTGLTENDIDQLMEKTREAMQEKYDQLSEEIRLKDRGNSIDALY